MRALADRADIFAQVSQPLDKASTPVALVKIIQSKESEARDLSIERRVRIGRGRFDGGKLDHLGAQRTQFARE